MQRNFSLILAGLFLICMFTVASEPQQPASDTNPSLEYLGNQEWLCRWRRSCLFESRTTSAIAYSADNGITWQEMQQPPAPSQISSGAGLTDILSVNTPISECSQPFAFCPLGPSRETESHDIYYKVGTRTYKQSDMVEGADGVLGLAFFQMAQPRSHHFQRDIYAVFSHDGGKTWHEPLRLNKSPYRRISERSLKLATDKAGNWLVLWCNGDEYYCCRSEDNAVSWTEPFIIADNNAGVSIGGWDVEKPMVSISDSGCWLVVLHTWTDGGDGPLGPSYVRALRSTDTGMSWSPCTVVNAGQEDNFSSVGKIDMATDHEGNWIVTWHARVPDKYANVPKNYDICYVVSSDDAHSWSPPKTLNTNAATSIGNDLCCSIATDGEGTWLAVWHSDDTLGGRLGRDNDILYARSTNNGETWSDPAPLNSNISPEVTDSFFSRSTNPHLVTDGNGCWLAVWSTWGYDLEKYGRDADIFISRSENNGRTWSRPIPANTDAGTDRFDDVSPHLAVNDRGVWILSWVRWDYDGIRFSVAAARSSDKGKTWSPPQSITDQSYYFCSYNASVPGEDGTWAIVFSKSSEGGGIYYVQVAHSRDEGNTWEEPITLSSDEDRYFGESQVAVSGSANWQAVWRYSFDEDCCVQLSRHAEKGWESTINITGGFVYTPQLFPGEPGHWILSTANKQNYYAKEMDAAIRLSTDDGQSWTERKILHGAPSGPLVLSYGGNGKWVGICSAMHPYYIDTAPQEPIYLIYSDDNAKIWTPKIPFLSGDLPVEGADAKIISDRKGNWLTIWQSGAAEGRFKRQRIFSSYSNDNGRTWSQPQRLDK